MPSITLGKQTRSKQVMSRPAAPITPIKAKKKRSKFISVLTSPKTTLALGATLATLLTFGAAAPVVAGTAARVAAPAVAQAAIPAAARVAAPSLLRTTAASIGKSLIPTTAKGALTALVAVPTVAAVLASSSGARKAVVSIVNPIENIKRGQAIGGFLEEHPGVKDVAVKAGLLGLAAGAATAAVIGGKKLIEKFKGNGQEPIPNAAVEQTLLPAGKQGIGAAAPSGMETIESPGIRRKRSKNKRQGAQGQTIRQSVRVQVNSINSMQHGASKRYLNVIPVRSSYGNR